MQTVRRNVNPFALMIDPQAVIAKIENSERLERLNRRICRPLDKPLLGAVGDGTETAANADSAADAATASDGDGEAAANRQDVAGGSGSGDGHAA